MTQIVSSYLTSPSLCLRNLCRLFCWYTMTTTSPSHMFFRGFPHHTIVPLYDNLDIPLLSWMSGGCITNMGGCPVNVRDALQTSSSTIDINDIHDCKLFRFPVVEKASCLRFLRSQPLWKVPYQYSKILQRCLLATSDTLDASHQTQTSGNANDSFCVIHT